MSEQLRDRLEQSIRDACFAIAADWAESLHGRRVTPGAGFVRGTKEPPPPVALSTLDDRAECCSRLSGWAHVVMDEQDLHPTLDGNDAVGLTRFVSTHAAWFAEHPAGMDVARELADSARKIERLARPERRDFMVIGRCPRQVAEDGAPIECGGQVRAKVVTDDQPVHPMVAADDVEPDAVGQVLAKCQECGHEDTVRWWESVIVPNLEAEPLLTVGELIVLLHKKTGRQIPEGTIRQWATTGRIKRHGKDSKGRTLYDRAAVLAYVMERAAA